MSRIGKQPVPLPAGVTATLGDGVIRIAGPQGQLELTLNARLRVVVDEAPRQVRVERLDDARQTRAVHGLTRNLIRNMTRGVTEGYVRTLQVVGVGYSAKVQGTTLALQLGYSHPVEVDIPEGLSIDPPESASMLILGIGSVPYVTVRIRGIDKQQVGEFAARIRRLKPPEPYKGKGIRYADEEIRRKAGKAFAAQE